MFERFTGRARHAVVLSQEEARLLDHNYIGTEHLLLGILGEPESVAGMVLTGFGMSREGVRREVEERVGRGKKAPAGHIPFTPRAKKTLELSLREALRLGHKYIGTEHILLGLIREGEGVAYTILGEHGDITDIRAAVVEAVPPTGPAEGEDEQESGYEANAVLRWLRHRLSRHGTSVPFQPGALSAEAAHRGTPAVEAALQQAARLAGPLPVGSHHLMLAALEDANSAASATLAGLGVDLDELRDKLRGAQVIGTSDEQPEQAGLRQMALEVDAEMLRIVLTDPVIVRAGKNALMAVDNRAAAAGEIGPAASGSTVIRGDLPEAAGLALVWQALHHALAAIEEGTGSPSGAAERAAEALREGAGGIRAEGRGTEGPGTEGRDADPV